MLIDSYPESLRIISPFTMELPLILAYYHNTPNLETVRLLFDSYPKAIFIDDIWGRTPLENT